MKKTLDFYKPWHTEKKALIEQDKATKAAMTAEDRRIHEEQCNAEIEKIIAQVERSAKSTLHFRIPFRRQRFAHLVKLATEFAEDSGVDITYETTAEHGFLRLETDQLIVDALRPDYQRIWKHLVRYADTFWVDTIKKYGDPAIQFTFFYNFQKDIHLKGSGR